MQKVAQFRGAQHCKSTITQKVAHSCGLSKNRRDDGTTTGQRRDRTKHPPAAGGHILALMTRRGGRRDSNYCHWMLSSIVQSLEQTRHGYATRALFCTRGILQSNAIRNYRSRPSTEKLQKNYTIQYRLCLYVVLNNYKLQSWRTTVHYIQLIIEQWI